MVEFGLTQVGPTCYHRFKYNPLIMLYMCCIIKYPRTNKREVMKMKWQVLSCVLFHLLRGGMNENW